MSPTSVMIAICFAPKERASLLVRSVAWVVLLSCCTIVEETICYSIPLIEFFGEINQTVNVEILGSCQHSTRGGWRSHRREARRQRGRSDCQQTTWVAFGTAIGPVTTCGPSVSGLW